MSSSNIPYQDIIRSLENQIQQRLEKLWRVFSWCSSILISISAGIIAATRSINGFGLRLQDRILVSSILLILTVYAWAWIRENLQFERKIRDRLDEIFEMEYQYPKMKSLCPDKAKFGYTVVIILLGLVGLAATWLGN